MLVERKINDTRDTESEDITDQDIPSSGETFDKQQDTHLNQKSACTGEIIPGVMAKEGSEGICRDTVTPYGEISQYKISKHRTLK